MKEKPPASLVPETKRHAFCNGTCRTRIAARSEGKDGRPRQLHTWDNHDFYSAMATSLSSTMGVDTAWVVCVRHHPLLLGR